MRHANCSSFFFFFAVWMDTWGYAFLYMVCCIFYSGLYGISMDDDVYSISSPQASLLSVLQYISRSLLHAAKYTLIYIPYNISAFIPHASLELQPPHAGTWTNCSPTITGLWRICQCFVLDPYILCISVASRNQHYSNNGPKRTRPS